MKDDGIHEKQSEMISSYQKEIQHLTKQVQELQFNQTLKDDNDINELRRKLASFENQQAEKTRAFNEQTTKLQSQVAKLRSALERGETTKQKLEYELALANKASSQEKRSVMERESKIQKVSSEQRGTIQSDNIHLGDRKCLYSEDEYYSAQVVKMSDVNTISFSQD